MPFHCVQLALCSHLRVFSAFVLAFPSQPQMKSMVTLDVVLEEIKIILADWARDKWSRSNRTGHCEISPALSARNGRCSIALSWHGLFYENRARWTKMSNVFTKCFATLENSFFKSLESLFINYVLIRSERAAVSVNDCSMVFSSVVYIFGIARVSDQSVDTMTFVF